MKHVTLLIMVLAMVATAWSEPTESAPTGETNFRLADGLEIELFASDPSIAKPIQMNFDARGRLWLVTSESYPQLEPGAVPKDKIYVLEDTDHDGRADKTTPFAEGLQIPTGIEIAGNGAYVGNSTDLIYLEDKNGDGVADRKQTVLTSFGTEDTHHLIHTFRFAPWGNLFFAQAVYIHSHVETQWGTKRLNGGGYWEFNPQSGKLDVFVTGMTNSWGLAFDPYGQAFGVDNDGYSVNYFPPGAHLIRTPNESHLYPSLVEGKPKYCGAEFVGSPLFPEDWQGNLITCDFRAHRIARYKISEKGGGYSAEELPEVLSTAEVSFRPVDVKFGPDGALYICDWFNPIINHGEVDFRDPRRDKTHGRIWRVKPRDSKERSAQLAKESTITPDSSIDQLIAMQKSSNAWSEHFSRRELSTRPRENVQQALDAWVMQEPDELHQLRALWCYESAGLFSPALLESLLKAKDHRVRAAAVRAMGRHAFELSEPANRLLPMLHDEHPRVRMEAVRVLSLFRFPTSMTWALSSLDQGNDPTLEYAIKLIARENTSVWLPTFARGNVGHQHPERWVMALLSIDRPEAVEPLLEFWRGGRVKEVSAVLAFIGKHGSPEQLSLLVEEARRKETSGERRAKILSALVNAYRLRQARPAGDLEPIVLSWIASSEETTRDQGIRLAGLWGIEAARPDLLKRAESNSKQERESAIESLQRLGGSESFAGLAGLFDRANDAATRQALLTAMVALDPKGSVQKAVPLLAVSDSSGSAGGLFEAFLSSQRGPIELVAGLAGAKLAPAVAEEGLKRINASGQALPGLATALKRAAGLPEGERMVTPQQIASLAEQVARAGDPHRGMQIYQRKELACATCHVIKGAGGRVGPELTTIGTSAPVDYLVESLLLPSAKVKENFHSLVVVTDEGKVISGIPEQQSETEITLRLADNTTVSIPKARIDETKMGGSLMPTDVVDTLPTQELVDLVRYLSELGKPGPFGPAEEQSARRWRLLGPMTLEKAERLQPEILAGTLGASEWRASLTTNDAWVYVRELALTPDQPAFFGETKIEVSRPGKIRLTVKPGPKGSYWLDGKPVEAKPIGDEDSIVDVELSEGTHTLLARVDLSKTPSILRLRAYSIGDQAVFSLEKP